jgi:hypothetical protein
MQAFGHSIIPYIQWRIENPRITEPSINEICTLLVEVYTDLVCPGLIHIVDWWPQPPSGDDLFYKTYTAYNKFIGKHSFDRIDVLNNDWRYRLKAMETLQNYLVDKNHVEYDRRILEIMALHRVPEDPNGGITPILSTVPWSGMLTTEICAYHLEDGKCEFGVFQTEEDVINALPVTDHDMIQSHLDTIQTFISTIIPEFQTLIPSTDDRAVVPYPVPYVMGNVDKTILSIADGAYIENNFVKSVALEDDSIIRNVWKNSMDTYFRARDTVSFGNIAKAGGITKIFAYPTNVGYGFFLQDVTKRLWFMLSLRALGMVIITPVVASHIVAKTIRVFQPNRPGLRGAPQNFKRAGAQIVAGIWYKLTGGFTKPPIVTVDIKARVNTFSFTVNLPKVISIIDPEQFIQEPVILFTEDKPGDSSSSQVLYAYMQPMTIFFATWGAGDILQYYANTKQTDEDMPVVVPDEPSDLFDIFEQLSIYMKTKDPAICIRFSETNQVTPELNIIKALDRLPWYKLRVSKDDAIMCLDLQNRLRGQNIIQIANMVDNVVRDLEDDLINFPSKYQLSDGAEMEKEQQLRLPAPLGGESGLVQASDMTLHWAIYAYDSGGVYGRSFHIRFSRRTVQLCENRQ